MILSVLIIPYFTFFSWIEDNRLFHKQFRNIFKVDCLTLDITKRMQEISKDEIEKGSDISADFKSEDRS